MSDKQSSIRIIIVGSGVEPELLEQIHGVISASALTDDITSHFESGNVVVETHSDIQNVTDGYHSFKQLYEHRHALYMGLLAETNIVTGAGWYSATHHDGSSYPGWVLVGTTIDDEHGDSVQISYHLPEAYVPHLKAAGCVAMDIAPQWDGHTSNDVVTRLLSAYGDAMAIGKQREGFTGIDQAPMVTEIADVPTDDGHLWSGGVDTDLCQPALLKIAARDGLTTAELEAAHHALEQVVSIVADEDYAVVSECGGRQVFMNALSVLIEGHGNEYIDEISLDNVAQESIYLDRNGLQALSFSGNDPIVDGRDMLGHAYNVGSSTTGWELVRFQQGPVPQYGVNGATNEALLAVLIHRTEHLNSQFPCEENEVALEHMRAALRSFESRTAKRIARGVEGVEVK